MLEAVEEAMEHAKIETAFALDGSELVSLEAVQAQIVQSYEYHLWLAGVLPGPFSD